MSTREENLGRPTSLRGRLVILVALASQLALCYGSGCAPPRDAPREPGESEPDTEVSRLGAAGQELFVHCGNPMRPAAEALAAEFEERYGIRARLNFGGSADLLAHGIGHIRMGTAGVQGTGVPAG